MARRLLASFGLVLGLLSASNATAAPIVTDTWYLGGFDSLGGPVTGAGPAGGGLNPGAPAWTFTIADDHILTVIDCCSVGDRFEVFDGAASLGTTALGLAGGECFDAASCFANANAGRGDFLLGAGTYSISMVVTSFVSPGNLFFNVRNVPDVPEPQALLMLATGLAGLAAARRRVRG